MRPPEPAADDGGVGEVEILGRRYRFKVPPTGQMALQQAALRLREELAAVGAGNVRGDITELLVLAALRLSLPTAADAVDSTDLSRRIQALTQTIHLAEAQDTNAQA